MSKLLDDIVICVSVALGLLIALYLAWASVRQGAEYPPTLISAFLGIAIAALTYRFLGGSSGTEFSMGVLKLGGSAALLLGTTWFVGDRLRDEVRLYVDRKSYLNDFEAVEKQRDDAIATSGRRLQEIEKLQRQLQAVPTAQGTFSIAEIRKMKPTDPFVRDIKLLVQGQEYPFTETLRDMTVGISIVGGLGSNAAFQICKDTLRKLNEGVDIPNTTVRLSRTPEDGGRLAVNASRAGLIGDDVCGRSDRGFDVQINCPAARELFAGLDPTCSGTGGLRGTKVVIGSLPN